MNVVVNPNFGHWICTICLSLLHYTHAYALLSLVGADGSQCGFVVTYYHMLLLMVTEKMADTMTGFLCCISVLKNLRFYCLPPAVCCCILLMFSLLKKILTFYQVISYFLVWLSQLGCTFSSGRV